MTSVPRRFQRDVYQEIERLVELNKDEFDRVNFDDVEAQLTAYLGGHPEQLNIRAVAHSLIDNYDRNRRPKVSQKGGDQVSLFIDDALIPIGTRMRVKMGSAQREDLVAWQQIEMTEHIQHTSSYLTKMEFINESLKRLGLDSKVLRDVWN